MSTKQLPTLLGTTSGASALIDMCLSQPGLTWFSTSADFPALHPLCLFPPALGSREVWQRVQCSCSAQCSSFPKNSQNRSVCMWVTGTVWLQRECMKLKHLRLYEREEKFLDFQCYLFCNLQCGMKSVVLPARLDQFGFNSLFKTEAL